MEKPWWGQSSLWNIQKYHLASLTSCCKQCLDIEVTVLLEYTPHLWDLECSGFYFYFPVGVEWLIGTKHEQPYLSMKRLGCIFSVKTLTMAFLLLIKHLLIATLDWNAKSFSITAQV